MPRLYTVEFENVAVTAAQDFFEILPATQKPCLVHALILNQYTDFGDAAEEILRFRVIRGHTTSGSGGSTATGRPLDSNDSAAGFTCEINNTTIASAGTAVNIHTDYFNIRTGYALILTPKMRWRVQNADLLVVRLLAAPTDSLSMSGCMYIEEL